MLRTGCTCGTSFADENRTALLTAAERFARGAGDAWIYLDTTSQMVAVCVCMNTTGMSNAKI